MSIRIYALAKQLHKESKDLVDICAAAGVEGKGSALAALTDSEEQKVRAYIQSQSEKQTKKPALEDPLAPRRPESQSTVKKVPVLKPQATKPIPIELLPSTEKAEPPIIEEPIVLEESEIHLEEKKPSLQVETIAKIAEIPETAETKEESVSVVSSKIVEAAAEEEETPAIEEKVAEEQQESIETTAITESVSPPAPITTGQSSAGHAASVRGENYRGPMRNIADKIPILSDKKKPMEGARTSAPSGGRSAAPSIRLAPLPKGAHPKPQKALKEPTPQKPDMRLPPEAIRAASQPGSGRSIAEHIRSHEEKQRQAEESKKTGVQKRPEIGSKKPETGSRPQLSAAEEAKKKSQAGKKRGRDGRLTVTSVEQSTFEGKKHRTATGGFAKRQQRDENEEMTFIPRQLHRQKKNARTISTVPRKGSIVIQLPVTVKKYAEATGVSVAVLIKKLMELGAPALINSHLDREMSELLAESLQLQVEVKNEKSLEDLLVTSLFEKEDSPEELVSRPPVVTFLGHVDHGKTSLLDRIIGLNVASGERGGITQSIRAYRVTTPKGDVTFVDTPGHEAFTEMRARGANCTDIAVLVVAADDGVMPQTEEAISHAKAAGVPIVVAMNKMDLPGANYDRAIQGLAQNELIPSEWGGETEVVKCSAITGLGIDELLQTLLTIAELHELKANPDREALGVVLESELQTGQGVVCKTLVRNGTLRLGDVFLCDCAYGRVRAMYDTLDTNKPIIKATPGTPVNVVGLDLVPSAGSKFCVIEDVSAARQIAEKRAMDVRSNTLSDVQSHVTLESLYQRISNANSVQTLNLILRADFRGSIDAIKKELSKLAHPEVKIKILQAVVGGISVADIQLADASDAIIVGFNVAPDENARILADRKKIQIRRYDIIYQLTADIKAALEGMLKPMEQVKELGRALVQRVYAISRLGVVAGCRVLSGSIERDARIRIIRDSRVIGDYPLDSLKREKDDSKEVREGYECGIKLKGFNDLKEGDVLEAFRIEEVARTF